jgi:hypothetical protein
MELKIVSKELHEKLKKVGFNEKICNCGGYPECICQDINPTLELAKMWFREKYDIMIDVSIVYDSWNIKRSEFRFEVSQFGHKFLQEDATQYQKSCLYVRKSNDKQIKSYDKALEAGLFEACKLLK